MIILHQSQCFSEEVTKAITRTTISINTFIKFHFLLLENKKKKCYQVMIFLAC